MSQFKKGDKLTIRSILHVENRTYQKGQECILLEDKINYQLLRVVMLGVKDSLGYDAVEYISIHSVLPKECPPEESKLFEAREIETVLSNLKELEK